MSLELALFEHEEFGKMRTVEIDGDPWIIAQDICRILDISDTAAALRRVDEADRVKSPVRSGDQERQVWAVNESGFYDLVLRSRKAEAREFRRWVTAVVLPQIRKTGQYSSTQELLDRRSSVVGSDAMEKYAMEVLAHVETLKALEEAAPRAELMNLFEDTHGLDVGAVASLFGYKAHQFHELMRSWGATMYNASMQIDPSPAWVDREWMGRRKTGTAIVLPKGLERLEQIIGRQVVGGSRQIAGRK